MKLLPLLFTVLLVSSAHGQARDAARAEVDRAELLKRHEIVLQAHLTKDAESWMAIESDTTIAVNEGVIAYQTRSERLSARRAYLSRTNFDTYRDLTDPVVRVSGDGSLGWVIAEVEVAGWKANLDGTIEDFSTVFAWIELYEKSQEGWKMTGNVSNSRSGN